MMIKYKDHFSIYQNYICGKPFDWDGRAKAWSDEEFAQIKKSFFAAERVPILKAFIFPDGSFCWGYVYIIAIDQDNRCYDFAGIDNMPRFVKEPAP